MKYFIPLFWYSLAIVDFSIAGEVKPEHNHLAIALFISGLLLLIIAIVETIRTILD